MYSLFEVCHMGTVTWVHVPLFPLVVVFGGKDHVEHETLTQIKIENLQPCTVPLLGGQVKIKQNIIYVNTYSSLKIILCVLHHHLRWYFFSAHSKRLFILTFDRFSGSPGQSSLLQNVFFWSKHLLKNQEKLLVSMYHVQKLNHIRVVQFLEKGYFTDGCAWHSLRLTKKQKITNVREVGEELYLHRKKTPHLRHHCIHMYSTKVGGKKKKNMKHGEKHGT